MKKIISILLVGLMLLSNTAAFADLKVTSISLNGEETLMGYLLSYENQTLSLEVEGQSDPVLIMDQEDAFKEKLSTLKKKDFLELLLLKSDNVYLLKDIVKVNPIIFCGTGMPLENKFTTTQTGDLFTVTIEENPSTGYTWSYTINDETSVEFIKDAYQAAEGNLVGASGVHTFTFKVKSKGVSTISFEYKRAWEESSIESLEILVYKTDDALFIEEEKILTLNDAEVELVSDLEDDLYNNLPTTPGVTVQPIIKESTKVFFNEKVIDLDVEMQVIEGVTMMPLAQTLRSMGYTVKWDEVTQTVEINKNAQWTSVKIGENAYFKNKMAASPLSKAPMIIKNRTLVPMEFFSSILDLGIDLKSNQIEFNESPMGFYSGYVVSMQFDGNGQLTFALSDEKDGEESIVIHTSKDSTFYNKMMVEGTFVRVITSQVTTMSMPPQTSGYIVY